MPTWQSEGKWERFCVTGLVLVAFLSDSWASGRELLRVCRKSQLQGWGKQESRKISQ